MFKRVFNSSLLSGSAVYLFSNILAAAIPFALLPILTRYLTPAEYGAVAIYQTLLAGLGAFIGISAQGIAGVKYYDDHLPEHELKYFVGNCLLVMLATTALAFLIVVIFRQALSDWLALETRWLLLSVFVSSATFVVMMRMGQWQVRKQAKCYGAFQVSQSLINMFLSLLLVVYFLQGAVGRIWVLSLMPLVYAVIALFILYKDGLLGFAWRPSYIREILTFGVPLIPHSVGYFLLSSVDRFVISDKLGLEQVGIYMVAVQLVSAMGLVFDAINNAYVPWLFARLKRNQIEEKRQIVRWTYAYCIALLGVVVIAFVIGPLLLIFIAGEKYSAATSVIGWLALGQVFHGMYLMVTNYIFYSKRTGFLSLSTLISGLLNVGLLMVLIPFYGLQGAAIAYATSQGVKLLLTWMVAQLRHPMPWFDFRSNLSLNH
jgi:O-antigen/teichoic acid export membrane protein